MKINLAMWRTALWTLVKMDKKEEWDSLDVVSKWLIATRSGVTTVTIYSCIISGLLAWRFFAANLCTRLRRPPGRWPPRGALCARADVRAIPRRRADSGPS